MLAISDETTNPSTPIRHTNPTSNTSNAGTLAEQIEYEDKNSRFEVVWKNRMAKGGYKIPSYYEKAAVLLFSWEKDADDMDVENEVNDLKKVFEDVFHYEVKREYLKPSSSEDPPPLKNMVLCMIAQFIKQFDRRNSLLIVYYAVSCTEKAHLVRHY